MHPGAKLDKARRHADRTHPDRPTPRLSSPQRLREPLRYHHTVSRTLELSLQVLFNFPSRYLFAIGLGVVFSLTRSLPRTLGCTPKQPDSREKVGGNGRPPYGPITLYGQWPLSSWTLTGRPAPDETLPNATFREAKMTCSYAMGCSRFIRHY